MRRQIQTPKYLLRRWVTLHLLRNRAPARLLEIGCGRGDLLLRLGQKGWTGFGLEIGPEARRVAIETTRPIADRFTVVGDAAALGSDRFDVVCALEVLEHIEDDRQALREWREFLASNGTLILTVPARMSKWTKADEYGGHYRRYERSSMRALLADCGLAVDTFWSYGFPLAEVTRHVRKVIYRTRLRNVEHLSKQARTLQSSFDSTRQVPGAALLAPAVEAAVYPFHLAQLAFLNTDLGDGYLVACRRR